MIRINLLGQARPRAARRPVDTGAALPVVFIGAGAALGVLALLLLYLSWQKQLNEENTRIKQLQAQKADLEQIKQQVDTFEAQKKILTQRVQTIEQLQRDRTGAQELLDEIADAVAAWHMSLPSLRGVRPDMAAIALGNVESAKTAGLPEDQINAWRDAILAGLAARASWCDARAAAGFVRRCHAKRCVR